MLFEDKRYVLVTPHIDQFLQCYHVSDIKQKILCNNSSLTCYMRVSQLALQIIAYNVIMNDFREYYCSKPSNYIMFYMLSVIGGN